jgi:flagellar biosynthesis protein FliP
MDPQAEKRRGFTAPEGDRHDHGRKPPDNVRSITSRCSHLLHHGARADAWENGIAPFLDGALPVEEALPAALGPFRVFMETRVDPDTYAALADLRPAPALASDAPLPLATLVPSFLLSEIERAFQVGFLIFLPFLIIDLVVAAVLMSMGMMMVPPTVVALPFKLAFFVVADGWTLVAGALVESYR